ncbi:MAG: ABC transporter permease [Chthonomonadales bacterium]|nr:ABC transporter permease [Chthonomonadales bacterium]
MGLIRAGAVWYPPTVLPYIGNRLLLAIPTLLGVSVVAFFLGFLAPGSPIDLLMGQHGDPSVRRRLEHEYGLDLPPLEQYRRFVVHAVRGDLGKSFANRDRPVSQMIGEQFPTTALLATLSIITAVGFGIPAGVIAALHRNRLIDRVVMGGVLLLVSTPPFVLAPLLMLAFALKLGWLPDSGWEGPSYWVLPALVLAARPAALMARLMRSSMLDVLGQDYIRTAMAKGLSRGQVIRRHALKNAFLPVLTAIGSSFGYLLTGSFVVETIFGIPGIGYESVHSILARDYPVIQGVALLVAALFVVVNLVVDVLYALVDPRIRYGGAR